LLGRELVTKAICPGERFAETRKKSLLKLELTWSLKDSSGRIIHDFAEASGQSQNESHFPLLGNTKQTVQGRNCKYR
jgi:hypothetical protein